ncbi:MAG: hypothetical protein M1826_002726 [Phylliscum demangeonii]|nr:MAG: hypothetical protein M1826_002726 [Phylliscum demangeonii]
MCIILSARTLRCGHAFRYKPLGECDLPRVGCEREFHTQLATLCTYCFRQRQAQARGAVTAALAKLQGMQPASRSPSPPPLPTLIYGTFLPMSARPASPPPPALGALPAPDRLPGRAQHRRQLDFSLALGAAEAAIECYEALVAAYNERGVRAFVAFIADSYQYHTVMDNLAAAAAAAPGRALEWPPSLANGCPPEAAPMPLPFAQQLRDLLLERDRRLRPAWYPHDIRSWDRRPPRSD